MCVINRLINFSKIKTKQKRNVINTLVWRYCTHKNTHARHKKVEIQNFNV